MADSTSPKQITTRDAEEVAALCAKGWTVIFRNSPFVTLREPSDDPPPEDFLVSLVRPEHDRIVREWKAAREAKEPPSWLKGEK